MPRPLKIVLEVLATGVFMPALVLFAIQAGLRRDRLDAAQWGRRQTLKNIPVLQNPWRRKRPSDGTPDSSES